jgi:threonine dehydrogenase-like Zn-dependent dehydrogenase
VERAHGDICRHGRPYVTVGSNRQQLPHWLRRADRSWRGAEYGEGRDWPVGGCSFAFDAVGVPTTALQILEAVKPGGPRADNQGGMAVLLGIPVSDVSVDLNTILLHQRHYCGSLGATDPDTDFPLFLEWVRDGKFPLGKLVDQPIFSGTGRRGANRIGGGTDSRSRHY